ncbi:DUF6705 family protein [Flavobacterium sp.]|uniref:DUF6705 family protein n=1 Tax=Flavobacterium sp. TaxID=239 RepID=UPI00248892F1|nr:DUF6705 family protein [Flavobacterium sp.]MDI1315777.1 hypothetical protein [Flavobacterium sp.]
MKKIFQITLILLFSISCKAQNPILPLYGNSSNYGNTEGAYYKDIDGFQNQFLGTWLYTHGSTSLKMTFIAKNMVHSTVGSKNYYTDYIVGEYQYIQNGVEKVNTLANLNDNYDELYDYNLCSVSQIRGSVFPKCVECPADEKRMSMKFNDPERRDIWGGIDCAFAMRRYFDGGVEKLKIWLRYDGNGLERLYTFDGPHTDISTFNLPYGEYVLVKQP